MANMVPNFLLIVHNVVSITSLVALFGASLFIFLNGSKQVSNVVFSLMLITVNVFITSHVIGVNITDPNLSKVAFMFNLSIFLIGAFFLHAVLAMIGKGREKLWVIIFIYTSSVLFMVLFSISPDLFLLPSVPKMYFPNYYNPGSLNTIRVIFLYIIIVPYAIYQLYIAYRQSEIDIKRKQYKYFIVALVAGFGLGFIPNFLIYNIPIDPLWGMLFGIFFIVPFTYGAIRYEIFDIKVIAKQAFFYSVFVVLVGGFISLINYSNNWIRAIYPSFPDWITTLVLAILSVTVGVIIWRQLRKSDLLKYEFITIITHKFRTPLTQIKWSIEELRAAETDKNKLHSLEDVKGFNQKLIDLTSTLVEFSGSQSSANPFGHFEKVSLPDLLKNSADSYKDLFSKKQIIFSLDCSVADVMVRIDKERVKFVIQTLLENALAYTPSLGKVSVLLESSSNNVSISVVDTGIGINKNNISLLFRGFYRTVNAKVADTEGLGIGLYLARSVAKRNKGDIEVYSEGEGKGST